MDAGTPGIVGNAEGVVEYDSFTAVDIEKEGGVGGDKLIPNELINENDGIDGDVSAKGTTIDMSTPNSLIDDLEGDDELSNGSDYYYYNEDSNIENTEEDDNNDNYGYEYFNEPYFEELKLALKDTAYSEQEDIITFLARMASVMYSSYIPSFITHNWINELCITLEVPQASFTFNMNGLFISIGAVSRFIPVQVSFNMATAQNIEYLAIYIIQGKIPNVEAANEILSEITRARTRYPKYMYVLGRVVLSFSSALMVFNTPSNNYIYILLFAVPQAIFHVYIVTPSRPHLKRMATFMNSFAAAVYFSWLYYSKRLDCVSFGFYCSIIWELPGITATMGILEMLNGELILGASRYAWGLVLGNMIAAGMYFGADVLLLFYPAPDMGQGVSPPIIAHSSKWLLSCDSREAMELFNPWIPFVYMAYMTSIAILMNLHIRQLVIVWIVAAGPFYLDHYLVNYQSMKSTQSVFVCISLFVVITGFIKRYIVISNTAAVMATIVLFTPGSAIVRQAVNELGVSGNSNGDNLTQLNSTITFTTLNISLGIIFGSLIIVCLFAMPRKFAAWRTYLKFNKKRHSIRSINNNSNKKSEDDDSTGNKKQMDKGQYPSTSAFNTRLLPTTLTTDKLSSTNISNNNDLSNGEDVDNAFKKSLGYDKNVRFMDTLAGDGNISSHSHIDNSDQEIQDIQDAHFLPGTNDPFQNLRKQRSRYNLDQLARKKSNFQSHKSTGEVDTAAAAYSKKQDNLYKFYSFGLKSFKPTLKRKIISHKAYLSDKNRPVVNNNMENKSIRNWIKDVLIKKYRSFVEYMAVSSIIDSSLKRYKLNHPEVTEEVELDVSSINSSLSDEVYFRRSSSNRLASHSSLTNSGPLLNQSLSGQIGENNNNYSSSNTTVEHINNRSHRNTPQQLQPTTVAAPASTVNSFFRPSYNAQSQSVNTTYINPYTNNTYNTQRRKQEDNKQSVFQIQQQFIDHGYLPTDQQEEDLEDSRFSVVYPKPSKQNLLHNNVEDNGLLSENVSTVISRPKAQAAAISTNLHKITSGMVLNGQQIEIDNRWTNQGKPNAPYFQFDDTREHPALKPSTAPPPQQNRQASKLGTGRVPRKKYISNSTRTSPTHSPTSSITYSHAHPPSTTNIGVNRIPDFFWPNLPPNVANKVSPTTTITHAPPSPTQVPTTSPNNKNIPNGSLASDQPQVIYMKRKRVKSGDQQSIQPPQQNQLQPNNTGRGRALSVSRYRKNSIGSNKNSSTTPEAMATTITLSNSSNSGINHDTASPMISTNEDVYNSYMRNRQSNYNTIGMGPLNKLKTQSAIRQSIDSGLTDAIDRPNIKTMWKHNPYLPYIPHGASSKDLSPLSTKANNETNPNDHLYEPTSPSLAPVPPPVPQKKPADPRIKAKTKTTSQVYVPL